MFNSKKIVKDVAAPLGNVQGAGGSGGANAAGAANMAKLETAKRLASKINLQKNLGAQVLLIKLLGNMHTHITISITNILTGKVLVRLTLNQVMIR